MNVFEVMREFRDDYKTYIPQFHAHRRKRMKITMADFDQAIAAMSELLEAIKENRKVTQDFANDGAPENYIAWTASEQRIEAAIAKGTP